VKDVDGIGLQGATKSDSAQDVSPPIGIFLDLKEGLQNGQIQINPYNKNE